LSSKTVEYDLSFRDLLGMLFGRKSCNSCGAKLERVSIKDDKGVGFHSDHEFGKLRWDFGAKTIVRYEYRCSNCDRNWPPRELLLPWTAA